MTALLLRLKGQCPPSLHFEGTAGGPKFDEDVSKLLEGGGLGLLPDSAEAFMEQVKAVDSLSKIPSDSDDTKKSFLRARRAVLLAVAAHSKHSLEQSLELGYLTHVKLWLDQTLDGSVGTMDFLLHLLSSIAHLPVTKSVVKDSGMGKAIGSIAKHKFCKGPNEAAILERVGQIKDAWHASVKERKSDEPVKKEKKAVPVKKEAEAVDDKAPVVKRKIKIEAPPPKKLKTSTDKKSSFSSLLKKVSSEKTSTESEEPKESNDGDKHSKPRVVQVQVENVSDGEKNGSTNGASAKKESKDETGKKETKKAAKRVKWADHFGDNLEKTQTVDGEDDAPEEKADDSWTDRKKRDRLREKELLAKVKRAKLMDDDDDDLDLEPVSSIKASIPWQTPTMLPPRENNPNFVSPEASVQAQRLQNAVASNYSSKLDVPLNPSPMTDVEQALDMTSQTSATTASIPFFVPQLEPVAAPAPVAEPQSFAMYAGPASAEFVSSLGLPLFLAGQDSQALQTLAQSPGLLNTMVDASGMYDQPRLLALVQTLSSNPQGSGGDYQSYGASYMQDSYPYGSATGTSGGNSRTGSTDGNLHVSNFGPSTTSADLIALFSPYVRVDEVVMKGSFAFVNTSDPMNAQVAKEALDGTFLGGMSIKINPATRRSKDFGAAASTSYSPSTQLAQTSLAPGLPPAAVNPSAANFQAMDSDPQAIAHAESVRDDKGNPATKNLFVAGYGQGTTEQHLRDVFGQYCIVIGIIMKSNFSFVNTSDKVSAVRARDMLKGFNLNGGALRINFAKETGRLGTSFDLTYNQAPGQGRPPPMNAAPQYYGRGF